MKKVLYIFATTISFFVSSATLPEGESKELSMILNWDTIPEDAINTVVLPHALKSTTLSQVSKELYSQEHINRDFSVDRLPILYVIPWSPIAYPFGSREAFHLGFYHKEVFHTLDADLPVLSEIDYTVSPRITLYSTITSLGFDILLKNNKNFRMRVPRIPGYEYYLSNKVTSRFRRHHRNNVMLQAKVPKSIDLKIIKNNFGEVQCKVNRHRRCLMPSCGGTAASKLNCDNNFIQANGSYMIEVWDENTVVVVDTKLNSDGNIAGQFYSLQSNTWTDLPSLQLDLSNYKVRSIFTTMRTLHGGNTLFVTFSVNHLGNTQTCHLSRQNKIHTVQYPEPVVLRGQWACYTDSSKYGIGALHSVFFERLATAAQRLESWK